MSHYEKAVREARSPSSMALVEPHRHDIYADSALVSRKFCMKHNQFVLKIESVLTDFPDLRGVQHSPKNKGCEHFYTEERTYRGQPYTAFMMNKPFFSLVAMRCESKKAREWQRRFNSAFYELEAAIQARVDNRNDPAWLLQRDSGKGVRASLEDAVSRFVAYALAQGSNGAKFYYRNFTTATYRALGLVQIKSVSLRDTLPLMEQSWLITAECVAQQKLTEYMDQGMPYKLIFKKVSEDLETMCKPLVALRETGNWTTKALEVAA